VAAHSYSMSHGGCGIEKRVKRKGEREKEKERERERER
jgi:hypothetical protein